MIIILVVLAVGFVAFILLNSMYKSSVTYKNANVAISKFNEKIPDNLQIANFGSTYAMYAFNGYKDLKLNAFNFSIDAQSLEMDDRLLRKYTTHIAPGATVVICLAACVTYYRYSMVVDKARYYEFLEKKDIPDSSIVKYIKSRYPITPIRIKSMAASIIKGQATKTIYSEYTSPLTMEAMKKNMKRMADGWIKLFHLKDLKQKDDSPVNEQNKAFNTNILKTMIGYCMSRGWRPVVVIPPFSDLLNAYFGDEFVSNSLGDMIRNAIGDSDIDLLDYRKHPSFQKDYVSFLDGGFRLNKNGSIKFIKMVLQDLNGKGHHLTNETLVCKYGDNQ